ncbi:hypothetical protein PAMC26577_02465 [Caballeronia sordidicola]|uniref:Uncharacterized protein n=1 Tax=Caballeronia sordidicola TaxID=196367 RepID=A0A242N5S8_CABSO|nr:hypothetical protein PAMC26577_02465 [Caballeronia sordidicola]
MQLCHEISTSIIMSRPICSENITETYRSVGPAGTERGPTSPVEPTL